MSQFVSYAQNYEDVMLWRALKHVQHGFYVDVGANDPKFDSVTQAFYERGWRGINIEPMQAYYEALRRERPEDINLPFAIGDSECELTIYEVPETGISSIIPDSVFSNKFLDGRAVIERKVPVTTLNKVLAEYARGEIHFLKIDVEGYEKAVLDGLDLRRWRPWILVMEATLPNTQDINPDFPEAQITSAGYSFVYFDGLNRFYLADEHTELRDAFYAPPNVFDYFERIGEVNANREKEEAIRELEVLRPELAWLRSDITYVRKEVTRLREENDAFRARSQEIERQLASHLAVVQELGRVKRELEAKRIEAEEFHRQYINVLYSLSYRVTRPLRAFYTIASRIRNRTQLSGSRPAAARSITTIPASSNPIADPNEDERFFKTFFDRQINYFHKKDGKSK